MSNCYNFGIDGRYINMRRVVDTLSITLRLRQTDNNLRIGKRWQQNTVGEYVYGQTALGHDIRKRSAAVIYI